jgi:hypothetical protein
MTAFQSPKDSNEFATICRRAHCAKFPDSPAATVESGRGRQCLDDDALANNFSDRFAPFCRKPFLESKALREMDGLARWCRRSHGGRKIND